MGNMPSSATSSTEEAKKPFVQLSDAEFSAMREDLKPKYLQGLEIARLDCKANRSMSLAGNTMFFVSGGIGAVLSALSPNHWPSRHRTLPFFLLGLGGILLDNWETSQHCFELYPDPGLRFSSRPEIGGGGASSNGSTSSTDDATEPVLHRDLASSSSPRDQGR